MFRYSFETVATPEEVFRALTDFSEQRLETWKRTLDPKKYELRELGDTWAVCKEGSAPLNIWVVLRYEWEPHGTVRWTMVESNHCGRGDGVVTIKPAPGSRSQVDVEIDHGDPWGLRGRAILGMQGLLGPRLFPRLWKKALDRYGRGDPRSVEG